jgi:quinol-cytochrome oxidoreductase complex cytochrome b subunit
MRDPIILWWVINNSAQKMAPTTALPSWANSPLSPFGKANSSPPKPVSPSIKQGFADKFTAPFIAFVVCFLAAFAWAITVLISYFVNDKSSMLSPPGPNDKGCVSGDSCGPKSQATSLFWAFILLELPLVLLWLYYVIRNPAITALSLGLVLFAALALGIHMVNATDDPTDDSHNLLSPWYTGLWLISLAVLIIGVALWSNTLPQSAPFLLAQAGMIVLLMNVGTCSTLSNSVSGMC